MNSAPPRPPLHRFRGLPSLFPSGSFVIFSVDLSWSVPSTVGTLVLVFGPSRHPHHRRAIGTMASADFSRFSPSLLTGLPLSGQAVRSPQVNMVSFASLVATYIFRTSCRDRTSLLNASSSVLSDLTCGFCTSTQGFVSGFLQTPSHEGNPCL